MLMLNVKCPLLFFLTIHIHRHFCLHIYLQKMTIFFILKKYWLFTLGTKMFCVTDNQKAKIFFKSFVINIYIPISGLFPRHFALSSAPVILILAKQEKARKKRRQWSSAYFEGETSILFPFGNVLKMPRISII